MVQDVVENDVVTFRTFSEILFRVIDDVIRAERSDKIDIPRTADTGHIRAKRLGDLHRECAYASRGAVDQDLLPRLDLSFVANSLQGGDARDVDRSRLLKCDVCWLDRDSSIRARTDILGKGSTSPAKHLVAWFELRHILANRFNRPCKINAQSCVLRFSQSNPHHTHDLGRAFNEVPVIG